MSAVSENETVLPKEAWTWQFTILAFKFDVVTGSLEAQRVL